MVTTRVRISSVCLLLAASLSSAFAMIDYCRNNTFDQPTNSEKLHFSKENSDEEFGIFEKFKCLHCCSHGYRSIEWFKDEHPYPWPTDVSTLIIYSESGNQTIYTQQLTAADSGKYWCIAKNETHFLRHEVHLKVSDSSISMGWPKTTYRPRDLKAAPGESVRFYCEAFVGTIDLPDFQSEILWEKHNSPEMVINGARIVQENIFREEKRVIGSYLSFTSVKQEDYGRYVCRVRNFGDQVVELSAWLLERDQVAERSAEIPIYFSEKVSFANRKFYVFILLLVLTAVTSTITFLHFGSYFHSVKKRIFQSSASPDESKKDLLIIYHERDAGDSLNTILKIRCRYSCCLHPLTDKSQIGEEELKAKANSFRGLLVLMTPQLVGGFWSSGSIYSTIQSLLKVHFTVICYFEQGLPAVDETERSLVRRALSKIHYVDSSSVRNSNFWNCLRLKSQQEENNGTGRPITDIRQLIPV